MLGYACFRKGYVCNSINSDTSSRFQVSNKCAAFSAVLKECPSVGAWWLFSLNYLIMRGKLVAQKKKKMVTL